MRKFFSYMFAGVLVSSIAIMACDDDTTGDDDTTSSSSSSGGSSSSSGGKSSTSSSSGGSSSGSTSSSSGGVTLTNELSDLTFTPDSGTVGTKTTHTFSFKYTGTIPNGIGAGIAPTSVPDGVTTAAQLGIDQASVKLDAAPAAGTVSGSFDWTPTVAGDYKFIGFLDADGDETTEDDEVQTDETTVTIAAAP